MYSNSKIYKIIDVEYNECYIGSTIQKLSKRMGHHREQYRKYKDGKAEARFTTSFILFDKYGLENCKIELIENYECKTKEELHQRESWYIRNNKCVNKQIPSRTSKEYYEDNKEEIKEKKKQYRESNKEKIKGYQEEYRESNKDKMKEYQKEYREANKDKIKEYYQNNKEKFFKKGC